ncbi:DUF1376 domain-containing protein [Pelagibius litoralis]|uniref:DUF1376 domain-containing protein n=1 Tax=Pelagibius litoralis TaxID=374515 RepID=A0A967C247_9PROT|nr:DUF1376 domain-containing protein [Pelagibius litoralis]
MAEFPAFPLFTDAYLGDTTHLTTIEHGAYLLLLIAMWRSKENKLPNDDKLLARYAKLTAGQWRRVKPVLWPFFIESSDSITQGRLTDEATFVRQHSRKQSDNAKSRWLKDKKTGDATAMPDGCQTDAPHPTPPIKKEEANASSKERRPTKGSRISEDWAPTPDQCASLKAGEDAFTDEEVAREVPRFRDHWLAASGSGAVKRDWLAAFRNWVRKSREFRDIRGSPADVSAAEDEVDAMIREAAKEADRRNGNEFSGNSGQGFEPPEQRVRPAAPEGAERPAEPQIHGGGADLHGGVTAIPALGVGGRNQACAGKPSLQKVAATGGAPQLVHSSPAGGKAASSS